MRYLIKYRHGDTQSNKVSLTLDDGPSVWTPKFLQVLNDLGVKATFFVIPENVRAFPDVTKNIISQGHELGAHVSQPQEFSRIKAFFQSVNESSIDDALNAIFEVVRVKPRFFRPSLQMALSRGLERALKNRGLIPILTSAYSNPRIHNSDEKLAIITKNLKSGDIIIIHDGHDNLRDSPRPEKALQILPEIINRAYFKNLSFVPVSELINEQPYFTP